MQLTMHLARKIKINIMGKKLTSWEKAARERELERERELLLLTLDNSLQLNLALKMN